MSASLFKQVMFRQLDQEKTGKEQRCCQQEGDAQNDFGTQTGSHRQFNKSREKSIAQDP
jgi:hypothetical protein